MLGNVSLNPASRPLLWYLLLASVWIVFSDRLLLVLVGDVAQMSLFQSVKGLLFVVVSAAFFYASAQRLDRARIAGREPVASDATAAGYAALAFVAAVLLGGAIVYQFDAARVTDRQLAARDTGMDHLQALEARFERSLAAAHALAVLVRERGGKDRDLAELATELSTIYPQVGALQLVPQGASALAGGGLRDAVPVYLKDRQGSDQRWGSVIVEVDAATLAEEGHLRQIEDGGYRFALYRSRGAGGVGELVARSAPPPADPVTVALDFAGSNMRLDLAPRGGWRDSSALGLEVLMVLFIGGLSAWLVLFTQRQPALLRREVRARTMALESEVERRRKSEAELRKLLRAVEQNPTTVLITDTEGVIEYVNPTFTRISGYSAAEAIGQTPALIKSGLTSPEAYAKLWQTIRAGDEWRGEMLNRRKDGSLYWESEVISPLKDEAGRITHFIAVKEDITERRATQLALLASNRSLRVLSLCNQALIRSTSEAELCAAVCGHLIETGGHRLAWVARLDDAGALSPLGTARPELPDLSPLAAAWRAEGDGGGALAQAVGDGATRVLAVGNEDPLFVRLPTPFVDGAAIVLPLAGSGRCLGALVVHAPQAGDFSNPDEVVLLTELAGDLAFGIEHLASLEQHAASVLALEENESRLRAITTAASDAIVLIGADGVVQFWNPAAAALFGYPEEEVLGHDLHELIAPAERPAAMAGLAAFAGSGKGPLVGRSVEVSGRRRDGSPVEVELSISALRLRGDWCGLGIVRDIGARKAAQQQIRLQTSALDCAGNAIVITPAESPERPIIVYANAACARITGYAPEELLGQSLNLLLGEDWDQPGMHVLRTALIEQSEGRTLLRSYRKDGSLFWNELVVAPVVDASGAVSHFVTVMSDVTERIEQEHQLAFHANYDQLTGLPNRNLAGDRLAQAIAHADRYGRQAAVVEIDLDHFKRINETLGHAVGDELLQTIAARLRADLRDGDTLARLGGDEFLLILQDVEQGDMLPAVLGRLLEQIRRPAEVAGQSFEVDASVGVSLYPRDGADGPTLLKYADTALFRAKEGGRGGFHFFTPDLNASVAARLTLETELKRALQQGELELFYQPQVDLRSGRIVGAEALMRWRHPERGLISPALFIPVAEESGLIAAMGDWALDSACRQARAWLDAGLPETTVAVNLSARQFRDRDVVELVRSTLAATGCPPTALEVELTESLAIQDIDRTIDVLAKLREMKVVASMDDFGTGYSSLAHLKRLALSTLKIDQSFVRDITTDPQSATIAATIIVMAHALGLKVIAEGVETVGQLAFLKGRACDEMQGYYFSKPVPAADFTRLLREGRCLDAGEIAADDPARTLLLVDDELSILSALKRVLRRDGYTIYTASSGAEALDLLARHAVGVIISDQRMPEMTGTELLGRVKEMYPDSVRMILSGYSELTALTDAINRGAVYKFLAKPWEEDELRAAIGDAFRRFVRQRSEGDDGGRDAR